MHGGSFCVQRDCNRDESTAVLHETCGTAALFVGCAKKSPKRLLTKTLVKLIGGGGKIKKGKTTKQEVKIMRLRKTMKRTAAAVLALSMAVSAAAMPASAGFNIDMSKVDGDVEITQADDNGSAKVTIMVGGADKTKDFSDGKEGNDVTITGDNTKPAATESLNAAEENADENTSEVEKPTEAEKSGETKTEGEDKTQNSAAEGEGEDDEPTSQELLAPEDEEKKDEQKDEQKPAETQETEQDKKPTDQVLLCGQNDPEANKEATKQETEEKSYGDTNNVPTTLSASVQAAANNVVSIINNSTNVLKVILRNLKVDAGDTNKSAVTVSGTGNVTLELDGKNELTGGTGTVQNEYYATRARAGLKSEMGKTTITDDGNDGTLIATGGTIVVDDSYAGTSGTIVAGLGIDGAVIAGGTIVAKGGDVVFESSASGNAPYFAAGSGILTTEISGGIVEATGGSAIGDGTLGGLLEAGYGVGGDDFINVSGVKTAITGGTVKATGGNGKSLGGFGLRLSSMSISGGTVIAQGGTGETGGSGVQSATISGGTVVAVGGAGSKTGGDGFNEYGTVKVTGGSVTAQGGKGKEKDGAAVGSEENVTGTVTKVDSNHVHQYSDGDIVKEATCTSEGYKLKKCGCGAEELERIPKKAHNWVENGHQDATCTKDGYTEYKCSACGATKHDNIISATGEHHFTVVKEVVAPTYTSEGYTIYKCETCDETEKRDVVPMLVPESNGASSGGSSAVTLTVTGAGAYETSIADGRYTVAVPAETAVLSGCLSNLKELKAQGVNTIVFRTQLRETVLNIDSMLSLGVDGTLFTLTHSGESAELTVGGVAHNELLH